MTRRACMLLFLSGCGVLLSVDEADERPPPEPVADAAAAPMEDATPPTDDGAIDDGLIDCLGVRREAFFCDGFESITKGGAPQPPWVPDLVPPNVAKVVASDERFFKGAQALSADVGEISLDLVGRRHAKVRWQRPIEPGPLALHFRINVKGTLGITSWDENDRGVVAAIRPPGSAAAAVLVYVAEDDDTDGRFVLQYEGIDVSAVDLGKTKANEWRCIRLVAGERGVEAYVDASPEPKGRLIGLTTAASVELGLSTNKTNKAAFFDDVIISPSLVADYCAL